MNRADTQVLVEQGEQVFRKADSRYQELLNEFKGEGNFGGNLGRTIHDSIRNLNRKIQAYLNGQLTIKQLISEFEFEKDALETELELDTQADARIKRFARRLLSSVEDFITKSGIGSKKSMFDVSMPRSKTVAYMLWLIGGFGTLGLHRFYLGKTGTGVAWVLTGGLFFMGALYDLFALKGMVEAHNTNIQLTDAKKRARLTERGNSN